MHPESDEKLIFTPSGFIANDRMFAKTGSHTRFTDENEPPAVFGGMVQASPLPKAGLGGLSPAVPWAAARVCVVLVRARINRGARKSQAVPH